LEGREALLVLQDVTNAGAAIPVHFRIMVYYKRISIAEIQGDLVKCNYKRAFAAVNIEREVLFQHAERSMRITSDWTAISGAGDPFTTPTVDVAFDLLASAKVDQVIQVRPTVYFVVGVKGMDLPSLVSEHVRQLESPAFDPGVLGKIKDTAVIYSFGNPGEPTTNLQYGPMGKAQWRNFGGAEAVAIEASLPPVGWGIGFYYQGELPSSVESLSSAKERTMDTLRTWWNMASNFVVNGSKVE
jgi:hypothetical protein